MAAPQDPRGIEAQDPRLATPARLAELERRLTALERRVAAGLGAPIFAGAPTTSPPDGRFAIDQTNNRLYIRVNGGWHYTALT